MIQLGRNISRRSTFSICIFKPWFSGKLSPFSLNVQILFSPFPSKTHRFTWFETTSLCFLQLELGQTSYLSFYFNTVCTSIPRFSILLFLVKFYLFLYLFFKFTLTKLQYVFWYLRCFHVSPWFFNPSLSSQIDF
jgi:hypothetical protein